MTLLSPQKSIYMFILILTLYLNSRKKRACRWLFNYNDVQNTHYIILLLPNCLALRHKMHIRIRGRKPRYSVYNGTMIALEPQYQSAALWSVTGARSASRYRDRGIYAKSAIVDSTNMLPPFLMERGSNFPLFRWLALSSLKHCGTTVPACDELAVRKSAYLQYFGSMRIVQLPLYYYHHHIYSTIIITIITIIFTVITTEQEYFDLKADHSPMRYTLTLSLDHISRFFVAMTLNLSRWPS